MPSPLIAERFSAAERLFDEYATAREARDQCIILVAGLRQVLEGLRQLEEQQDRVVQAVIHLAGRLEILEKREAPSL
jgi:hypothetical protein